MEPTNLPACLPEKEILRMAKRIARDLRLPKIDAERLYRAYEDPEGKGSPCC